MDVFVKMQKRGVLPLPATFWIQLSSDMLREPIARIVRNWLLLGCIMVLFQVIIGGITRLTDSGLSITEWAVIQGALPPMNHEQWREAFEAYKQAARRQYESLHADMTLGEFKWIYFWEYLHRNWARLMGLVFAIPFFYFWRRNMLPRWLMRRLGVVIALAAVVATFGWVMVKSGLNDDTRTWVSAYKLIVHLGLAVLLFGYLLWTWFLAVFPKGTLPPIKELAEERRLARWFIALLFLQILLGGLMAGMRAGLVFPHFPVFIRMEAFLKLLAESPHWSLDYFLNYEPSSFIKGTVQLLHRVVAWGLLVLGGLFAFKVRRSKEEALLVKGANLLVILLIMQFLLGILTVVNSIGRIPIALGVLHQGMALLLLGGALFISYVFGMKKEGM